MSKVFLPKRKKKNIKPITKIGVKLGNDGKLTVYGDGFQNLRQVGYLVSTDGKKLYLLDNKQGYEVQMSDSNHWYIPCYNKELIAALRAFIGKGLVKARREVVTFSDGRKEPLVCAYAPEPEPQPTIDPKQITLDEYNEFMAFLAAKAAARVSTGGR